ncbi:MAG TPA: hypothetical protein ENH72_09185 [Pseudomonas sabulinigri]|uniref:MvaI/BcnI restriction endonuclease domain-containing protein n=1 Tax=marine sediment metagenome TaxID=412755 RepID=A0A0F9W7R3_9ZZZZ|nr:hypothetical protein [Halopseudomonas sabulinigri]HEC50346.1 hypothetical protein [Halopseudomonas sabulinigri]
MIQAVSDVLRLMQVYGATRFYAKKLAPNDNSKNQIYLGGDLSALNVIPYKSIYTDSSDTAASKRDRAKADINFAWVDEEGCFPCPGAQLILYPKYPEVRMSGLLKGCHKAPREVIAARDEGRTLIFGVTQDGRVLGYAANGAHAVSREMNSRTDLHQIGVFIELSTYSLSSDSKTILLTKLQEIYRKHWISAQKLGSDGVLHPYMGTNAGGYTLEAELGISPNGYSEPDYLGWEIKQYGVNDFNTFRPKSPVTLMTPEPTGGIYRTEGVEHFIRQFGYPDTRGRPDRRNFGGIYDSIRSFHARTGLKLELVGIDEVTGKITDMQGGVFLVSRKDEIAASWGFSGMMEHWNRKHAKAAYIPSLSRKTPPGYCYGPKVLLCEKTDFSLFLEAMIAGKIYYDPGIKMEGASSGKPKIKRRSQFRVKHSSLKCLYHLQEEVTLTLLR